MLSVDFTFLWVAVNLLVLYLGLRKFLFKRLGGFMESRSEAIAADIEKGRQLKAEGDAYRLQYEERLQEVTLESKKMLDEARKKASREYEDLIAQAKKEAQWIIANAREEADQMQNQAQAEIRDKVIELALEAASKVLEESVDNKKNRELVQRFLDKEEAA